MIVYRDEFVTLHHGDAREYEVFDGIIVTDPPWGIEVVQRRSMPGMRQFAPMVGDDTQDLAAWLLSLYPRPMFVWGANSFPHLLPERGVWTCWDKRCGEKADRMFGSPFELAWQTASLGKRFKMYRVQHGGVINADGRNADGRGVPRIHPTQKPIALMERILADLPDGTIVDPFAGSASTLIAARNLGRRAVGIELDEQYIASSVERLAATHPKAAE